jgi:hypothetical protein
MFARRSYPITPATTSAQKWWSTHVPSAYDDDEEESLNTYRKGVLL